MVLQYLIMLILKLIKLSFQLEIGLKLHMVLAERIKPTPRCVDFITRAFVDPDRSSNLVARRSRPGFIALLNSAPVLVCSKKQGSCNVSIFGSEFM